MLPLKKVGREQFHVKIGLSLIHIKYAQNILKKMILCMCLQTAKQTDKMLANRKN